MKLSEVAKEVIRLVEARSEYWETELPKRHPDYPLVNPGEDSGPPAPQDAQLRKLLMKLPEDMIYKLILIMDLGHGYFSTRDLAEQFEQIKDDFSKPEEALSFIMEIGSLAHYLTEGLAKLEESKIDVDKLLQKPARARK